MLLMYQFLYLPLGFVALLTLYYASLGLYNLYLHPLSRYPGPRLAAATSLYFAHRLVRGTAVHDLARLHDEYGDVVRIGPNDLTYIDHSLWKEIYGYTPGRPELVKDPRSHDGLGAVPAIVNANTEHHAYLRKLLSHGFSDKALREQEPVIQRFVDLLIRRLGEESLKGEKPLDIAAWFNYCTFDIIGFLVYGESWDCLSTANLHPWIAMIFDFIKFNCYGQAACRLPRLLYVAMQRWGMPKGLIQRAKASEQVTQEKVLRRLANPSPFPDLMGKLISAYQKGDLPIEQLGSNGALITIAGSETTASLLAGATYHLLRNPTTLRNLVVEIRSTYTAAADITIATSARLKYLHACLEEALRVHPPSPDEHMRITPPEGLQLAGQFVPGGTAVGIPMYAACNSARNFRDPEQFAPDRWLGDPRFETDRRGAMQPFGIGPRNCLGQNLAYVEMRLILAKLLWSFDLELCGESEDWGQLKAYMVWDKRPLWVKLTPAGKGERF